MDSDDFMTLRLLLKSIAASHDIENFRGSGSVGYTIPKTVDVTLPGMVIWFATTLIEKLDKLHDSRLRIKELLGDLDEAVRDLKVQFEDRDE